MNTVVIATIMRPKGETGVQTHFNSFIHYLDEQSIQHQLITPFSYYLWLVYPIFAMRKVIHAFSGSLSVWWYRYWHKLFLQLALKQYLTAKPECVIYAQCPVAVAAALAARTSNKQRVIMVTHFNVSQADEWVGKGSLKSGSQYYLAIKTFEETVLPKLDGIVFVSEFMRTSLYQRIPKLQTVNHIVIPNFLSDPGITATTDYQADLINIGSLEARKNQKYALEILAAIRKQGINASLTLVGDGPDKTMLLETAKALNINDLVTFTGFISNAATLIGKHKALIHVATIENLPLTLLEAMARARPIFAVPVGGIPEVLAKDQVGFAIPAQDADAAATLIIAAIQDNAWLETTGKCARQQFLLHYVDTVSAQRLIDFLRLS